MYDHKLPSPVYDPTPASRRKWLGAPMKRKEDPPLVTGSGIFFDDVILKDMLYAAFCRSPYSHAKILRVDTSQASRSPGVVAVFTGEDLAIGSKVLYEYKKIPSSDLFRSDGAPPKGKGAPFYGLALSKAKYVGEPVAVVVANDRYLAADAATKVLVEYEPLQPVVEPEKAMEPGSSIVNEEWGDNIAADYFVEGGNLKDAFSRADRIVRARIREHRHAAVSMECRGILASYNAFADEITIWVSAQRVETVKTQVANLLGIHEGRVRIINRYVGGSYGEKLRLYEELVIPYISKKLLRPVKWTADRQEHLFTSGHARDEIFYVEAAVRKDGRVLGLKVKQIMDTGHILWLPALTNAGMHIPGPYKIENYRCDTFVVSTNKAAYSAYRGLIKLDSNFAIERTLDIIAQELGLSPTEVRLKNFIGPEEFPYKMVTGCIYDSGDYPTAFKKALELIGYDDIKARQSEWRSSGKYVGVAACMILEPTGAGRPMEPASDFTTIKVEPSGTLTVLQGVSSNSGQGHQTSLSQVIADELGVKPEQIVMPEGDTAACRSGSAYSSRFSVVSVSSAALAARSLRKKILEIAGHNLKAFPEDVDMIDGQIFVKSKPELRMELSEIARIANSVPYLLPPGMKRGLEVTEWFESPNIIYTKDERGRAGFYSAFAYAAAAAKVQVDIDTGAVEVLKFIAVHDCGTIINPAIMEVQDQGSFVQGFGGSLYEQIVYDGNGQLLNPNLMDYLIPGIKEAPELEVHTIATPSPYTILGTKGGGETCLIAPFVTLPSAVEDALEPFGVKIRSSFLSPENILKLIKDGSGNKNH